MEETPAAAVEEASPPAPAVQSMAAPEPEPAPVLAPTPNGSVLVATTMDEWKHFSYVLKDGRTYTATRPAPLKEAVLSKRLSALVWETLIGLDISPAVSQIAGYYNEPELWPYVFVPGLCTNAEELGIWDKENSRPDWESYEAGELIKEVGKPAYDWFLLLPPRK